MGFWSRLWNAVTGGNRRSKSSPAPTPPPAPIPESRPVEVPFSAPEPPPKLGPAPPQMAGFETSYWSNVGPFAMDPRVSEAEFARIQQLFFNGFVVRGHADWAARDELIDELRYGYGIEFDWAAWRAEYSA